MSQVFIGYGAYGINGVDDEFIRFIFAVTLGCTSKKMDSEAGLILYDDASMQHLNHRYRGKNSPTNVLSFTNTELAGTVQGESDANYLGDIYISYAILVAEAASLQISEKDRFAQLFVHGLLHLLGYDHEQPAEMVAMEALEDQIIQLAI